MGYGYPVRCTANGRRLKFMNLIDEHSRLCLAIRVGKRCKARDVVTVLEELTSLHPAPAFILSDNDPEFTAQALQDWCKVSTTTSTAYIAPGPPGRKDSLSHSTTASWMRFSTPSCSPPLRRRNSWLIAGAGSTTHIGRTRPSRGVRHWRQLKRELMHDHKHPLS